jgi:putative Ca2+/H+ antiporter (TMEM165/GDT1 family)
VNFAATIQAFATILPAELPDKTALACVVLVGHHRRRSAVFAGAAAAFALHVSLAVAAGSVLTNLPGRPVALATALAFGAGAAVMWRSARPSGRGTATPEAEASAGATVGSTMTKVRSGPWTAVLASFGVVAVAEFGDLTELATAGLAVRTGAPLEVAIGSLAALCAVAGLAILLGQQLQARLRVDRLQRLAAVLFGALAVATLTKAF